MKMAATKKKKPAPGDLLITGPDLIFMRQAVRLSQAELARRMGYARGYWWQLEHDRRKLPYTSYRRLLDVLSAARDDLDATTTRLRALLPSA